MATDSTPVPSLSAAEWVQRGLVWAAWVQGAANTWTPDEWHNHLPGMDADLALPLPPSPFLPKEDRRERPGRGADSGMTSAKQEPEAAPQLDGGWRLR